MKRILIILLSIYTISAYSQSIRLTYETGYGMYSLNNLKEFQELYSKQINNLPVKMIVRFPGYINHSASIGFYMDKNNIWGFNASYLTTGGRNYLSDYSGEYKLDMILNAYQFGIESEHIRNLNNKFNLNTNFKLGLIKSNLNTTEYLIIYDAVDLTNTGKYSQLDFFLEPNLNISYNIIRGSVLSFGLGYNLNTSSFYNGLINWSGFRTRIGISYTL